MATSPTTYSPTALEQLWIAAGGSTAWAPDMAAIAYYEESGGSPSAENASGATGLWQELGHGTTAEELNPDWNALEAVKLLGSGAGISNWGTGTGDTLGTDIQTENNSQPYTVAQLAAMGYPVPTLTSAQVAAAQKQAPAVVTGAGVFASHGNPFSTTVGQVEGAASTAANAPANAVDSALSGALSGILSPIESDLQRDIYDWAFIGFGLLLVLVGLAITFHSATGDVAKGAAVAAVAS